MPCNKRCVEIYMFSIFKKDPLKKLNQQYLKKLALAMTSQRNGDIKSYSLLSTEAQEIREKILELEKDKF